MAMPVLELGERLKKALPEGLHMLPGVGVLIGDDEPSGIPNYWRLETSRFKGQLPGEELPVLFAYALTGEGEFEQVGRCPAGRVAKLTLPLDPADLLP
ncbi:hypothetical protein ACFYUD_15175 [Nocardia tengchongensis]|uniref:hypothetical protein n=1 Tax=Nocardia tengchongensis TaxID=2055889 RepID=UPI0036BC520B